MRVLPTQLGIKGVAFLIAIEVVFFATTYSNLFFLLLSFLTVLGALGVMWSLKNLRGSSIELLCVVPAPTGSTHAASFRLDGGRRMRVQVTARLRVAGKWHEVAHVTLLNGETTAVGTIPGLSRGVHRVDAIELASRYPFGICEWRSASPTAVEVIAHPQPTVLPPHLDLRGAMAELTGNQMVARAGNAITGLREFRTGDPPRSVHWKASSRRGSLVVKETDQDSGDVPVLTIDRRMPEAELEEALSQATALLLRAAEAKEPAVLCSQGIELCIGEGGQPTENGLRWLALAEVLPADGPGLPPAGAGALHLPAHQVAEAQP